MKIFRFFLLIFLSFVAPFTWGQAPEAAEEEVPDFTQSYTSKVESSRKVAISWLPVLSHHRTYRSVYGGLINLIYSVMCLH